MTSHVKLDKIGVDFVLLGAGKNLRLSLLDGLTGGRLLPSQFQTNSIVIKALEDLSLELKTGDRVGLIGHNGAGKSTLLRVLAGVYKPTSGNISIQGKVTPLLHQSPGLEMEDSGFDNIITIGMLLGMGLSEIKAKVGEIIAFSDLGDYIHLPVRTYSSGMLARLAFSVATAIDPGILILDEGIGTADARFTDKASKRIKDLIASTDILVLASHSTDMIESMCDKALLMHHGKVVDFGNVHAVTKEYRRLLELES